MNVSKSAGSEAPAWLAEKLSGPLTLNVNSSRSVNAQLIKIY